MPMSPTDVIELTSITDGKITKVNLSPGHAEVTRTYKLVLQAGVNQVKISGLPRDTHRDSLRVEGRGAATIHDVSVAPTLPAPADPETASALSKQHKLLEDKIRRCKDVSAFLEKSILGIALAPADYTQIAVVVQAYERESATIDERVVDLQEELEELRLRRDEARGQATDPLELTAIIGIAAEKGGEAEVVLTYAVPDASWEASYDIRVDMQSKNAPFSVRYKAAISQFTGEDWDNVQLALDTVKPTFALVVPSLEAYRLSEEAQSTTSPASSPSPNTAQAHTVTIAELTLDADFSWLVVPKIDLQVYLQARVKNISEHVLVAGPANIYIDGSFVAKSRFPAVNPQETFEYSLGVDPSVRTTYAPLSKKTASSGLVTKTTTTTYSRQITVRNTKATAIQNVKILDRIPVSEDAQIVVKLLAPALRPPPPPPLSSPSASKTEKSPSSESGGGKFSGLKSLTTLPSSVSSLRKASKDVVAQWEGEEEGEVGTGSNGKLSWVCAIPPQEKISVELRWEESRPVGMKLVNGAR
ncbi:hypothetical protein AB1N83_012978 [Pleurotus pulmonarius]